jgi:phosphohistidine phosphatase
MGDYKDLYIVRHGKAVSDYFEISDIDRPLKERGIVDSANMANRLLSKDIIPDKIITSSAVRAFHSASVFCRAFDISVEKIQIVNEFYLSGPSTLLDKIANTENKVKSLMIFGHNPGFTDLANYFLNNSIDNMPTSGVVGIRFNTKSWSEISKKKVESSFFDYPKNSF